MYRSAPNSNATAQEFYSYVIDTVTARMEEKLKARGLEVEQIDDFKNVWRVWRIIINTQLWKKKCLEVEKSQDDSNEDQDNQIPDEYSNTDLYSQHLQTMQHPYPGLQTDQMGTMERPLGCPIPYQNETKIPEPLIFPSSPEPTKTHTDDDDSSSLGDPSSMEDEDETVYEATMLCLFKSVRHHKSRHKCEFVNCVLKYRNREYFFLKCTGEIASVWV